MNNKTDKEKRDICKDCEDPLWKQLIRPTGFIATLIVFFILTFTDGNIGNFHVRDAYLPILETVLVTIIIALYGSRGGEKITKNIFKRKDEEE